MRAHLLAVLLAVGCGETQLGPFQALPLDNRIEVLDLDAIVHVARDRFGVAHVYAKSFRDLGFAQGYVMAHDRLPQMEMLRRFASGTLAELYGAGAEDLDIEMRFHRLRQYARDTWNELQAGGSPSELQLVEVLQRFSDGVNAYVDDVAASRWLPDPILDDDKQVRPLFSPSPFVPWSPTDSIAIMGLFLFSQSWTVPEELDLTAIDLRLRRAFPGGARAGISRDVLALEPLAAPNAARSPGEVGTRAPGSGTGTPRPQIDDLSLLDAARAFFSRTLPASVGEVLGPNAFMRPYIGSTAFAVGDGTSAMLAGDLQLALSNPTMFYPMHQIVAGALQSDPHLFEAIGLNLPGVPVVVAGTNGQVGWVPLVGTHDVNDIYLETFVPCAAGICSRHAGELEPLQTFTESIDIGNHGVIERTRTVTFEVVPRHGPVIPNHTSDVGLSIRYTGYVKSRELVALWDTAAAAIDVIDASRAFRELDHGGHWATIDVRGAAEWMTFADVPDRPPGAMAWDALSPDGAAPFFVLDGRAADHEWRTEYLPPLTLPTRSLATEPFIAVADGDPLNATTDGEPLNQVGADGVPLYLGIAYASGLREARLASLVADAPIEASAMSRIHHDTYSVVGERLKQELARIAIDPGTTGPSDVAPYLASLSPTQRQALVTANTVLDGWTLATPIGQVAADADSAATLLFNTWMHYFATAALGDELDQVASFPLAELGDDRLVRIVYRMLLDRAKLVSNPATGQPILCDRAVDGGDDSCTKLVLEALVAAVTNLEMTGGPPSWRWGARHELELRPLFPDDAEVYALPNGFPQQGDMFAIDRSDGGWADLDFRPRTNPAYRVLLLGDLFDERLVLRLELPGGTVLDRRDPHYRDLLERSYLTRTAFDVPFTIDEITSLGETRWEFR